MPLYRTVTQPDGSVRLEQITLPAYEVDLLPQRVRDHEALPPYPRGGQSLWRVVQLPPSIRWPRKHRGPRLRARGERRPSRVPRRYRVFFDRIPTPC